MMMVAWVGIGTTVDAQPLPYPTTQWGPYNIYDGEAAGSVTWYNRSVGVQGYVSNGYDAGSTTVQFVFVAGSQPVPPIQTRTATDKSEPFNFTQAGPVGGITDVAIYLCDSPRNCILQGWLVRPKT